MSTTFKTLAVAVALIATASGCRTMTGRTAGQQVDNKTTVATVKAKLVADRLQNLTWVNVDANDGVVYLTGNAKTAEQKARATELAQRVHGVERVVNNIVVNASDADTASAPAASPATTSSRAGSGTISGEVVNVDHGTGDVTLRMASGGSDMQLRLPPSSVRNVKVGDHLSVSVNAR
jgi:hyperosmotically inducible periplasmic protein